MNPLVGLACGYKYGEKAIGQLVSDEAGHECAGTEGVHQRYFGKRHFVFAEKLLHRFAEDGVKRQRFEPLLLHILKQSLPYFGAHGQPDDEEQDQNDGQNQQIDEPFVDVI